MLGARSAIRHTLDLPARLRLGDRQVSCRIRNLSSGGVMLIGISLAAGERATLKFSAPHLKHFEAGCIVRWCSGHATGLQFVGLGAVHTSRLARYIHHATRTTERLPAEEIRRPATSKESS